ncbi:MAG: polyprenyl synthetase family protein [Mycobacterium sp.]
MSNSTTAAGVDLGDPVFAAKVRGHLGAIETLIVSELGQADPLLTESVLHLFHAGGKRFRPLFTVLSAQTGPDPDNDEVILAGAVCELIHLATLYHDDVMDEAQKRRGVPSANARWGNNVAILAGDYLLATASRLVSRLGPTAVRIVAETFAELVTGQMRETVGVPEGGDETEHYLKVIHEKTGSLIAATGRFGAMTSRCDDEQIERMSRLGAIVGTAFQISDDIIDIESLTDESGKTPGTDLREGVHTLPMLYALRDTGPGADRLRTLLAAPITDDAEVEEALTLLRASDGLAQAKSVVVDYADRAKAELVELPQGEARDALGVLIEYTVRRHG